MEVHLQNVRCVGLCDFPYLCVIPPVNKYCMRDFFSFVVRKVWKDSQKTDQVRFMRSVLVSEVMTEVVFLRLTSKDFLWWFSVLLLCQEMTMRQEGEMCHDFT